MNCHGKDIKIIAGNASRDVAQQICDCLGIKLCDTEIKKFSDGEISTTINESIRGSDVFIVQSTCAPVNDNLMELLIMIDACKRASAARITAVMPYMGYARQDRKAKPRDPISAKLVADLVTAAGADRFLSLDLHADQIQGFFNIPVDHLFGVTLLAPYFREAFAGQESDFAIVSPDFGSVTRARKFSNFFDVPIAIIDKRRPQPNVSAVMNIIGDVKGKNVILVDDMIDTAGTLCNAAKALVEIGGAKDVYACASHAVLSGPAIERLAESPIKEVVFLDTIEMPEEKKLDKFKVIPIAPFFAEAIKRIYEEKPVSVLHK